MNKKSTTGLNSKIVVGIPTYRRPVQLLALLESLLEELHHQPALVIVADNECGEDAKKVVNGFAKKWPSIICIPVPERGVSQVRNALIAKASIEMPDWEWLVMVDDDGLVTPGWLNAITKTGDLLKTHLVGGPVTGPLPEKVNFLAKNSIYAARRRWKTGLVPTLNQTQNLAISKRTMGLLSPPFFRERYGASGGEDYDFFRQVLQAGGSLGWCDEALVIEPPPPNVLGLKAVLIRYFTTGTYMAVVDTSYDGKLKTFLSAIKGLVMSIIKSLIKAITFNQDGLAKQILLTSHYFGRLFGLIGVRTSRYVEKKDK